MKQTSCRHCLSLAALAALMATCAAGCSWFAWLGQPFGPPEPRVLPPSPTIVQVIEAVNRNNSQIHSFIANQAMLRSPGQPSLQASLAFERPGRLRLRASTGFTGTELDLGSNDELFWFWIRRDQRPAVYYCRHDQFAACPARSMLPIEPEWLMEALGTAELDPGLPYQGPIPLPGDRLQITSTRETPNGPTTKATIIDAGQGWILEQRIYDAQGRLRAVSVASGHRRDPLTGLVMPSAVRIDVPLAQFSMQLDLGNVQINQPPADPAELWSMPSYPGYPTVDLCTLRPTPAAYPPGAAQWRPTR